MKHWLALGFFMMISSTALHGQVDTASNIPVFYERGAGDTIRLFYDDHYYLVDRHCEFKAIERVGGYDFQRQVFMGEFADFDNYGRKILEGRYVDGKKQGDFKAYHPNGRLKWQLAYSNGVPVGSLNLFYPDGKPLLEVSYTDEGQSMRILNFWDKRGRQRVTDGKGRYEFSVIADGYNEFGYIRYNRKGKVVDGRPQGNWTIEYVFADGKERNAGYEFYNKGQFVQGYEAYTDETFFDAPRYHLVPIDFSNGSEAMVVKGCTIDEHTGFTVFLAEYLSDWFDGAVDELPDPVEIEFTVTVKETGEPRGIEMKTTFDTKPYASLLLEALNGMGYWLPSYSGNEYIEDKLNVTMAAFPDARDQKIRFFDVNIQRENGR